MSVAPIRDLYRTFVPEILQDVILEVVVQPALAAQMMVDRELARQFPESAEPHVQAVLQALLRPGDTFVDVGASLGGLAAPASRLVAPGGTVVCFEPVPANFMRLTKTLSRRASPETHLVLENRAVGGCSKTVQIHLNFWDGLHTTEPEVNRGGRVGSLAVEQVTLDEALAYHRVEHVSLLKVDVEGAEKQVLEGARQLLTNGAIDAVVLEICNPEEPGKAHNAQGIAGLFADAGYDGLLVTEAGISSWDFSCCKQREDVLFVPRGRELPRLKALRHAG